MVVTALSRLSGGVMDALIPRMQNAALPPPTDDFWYGPVGSSFAGQQVTGQAALTHSGCWAATNAIAGLFGALPFKSYRKTKEGREEADRHPTYKVLSREPNPEMDSFVFWEMMTQWWVNYGNAFAEIQRLSNSDAIFALWPIHPTRVKPERDSSGNWLGRWEVKNNSGAPTLINSGDMLNIVGHLSDDGLIGKGVITYASQAIAVGLAEAKYQGSFYSSGGKPTGVLEHPGKLGPEARADLRREWKRIHSEGSEIAVMWEGMKFNPISVDPDHAKLIDSRVFSIQELARFYDLPPHVLYELSKGTFSNTEEMNRFLVSQSLLRRMVRVEKACDRQLFTEPEKRQQYFTKFNVNALLRGDPKQQAEVNQIEFNCGALSVDEWRAQKERNKLADGQGEYYWVRRDIAPIDLVISAAEKSIEEPTPIPATPPTPDTPMTPDEATQNRMRELRELNRSLVRNVRESKAGLAAATSALAVAQDECNEAKAALSLSKSEHASAVSVAQGRAAELQAQLESVNGDKDAALEQVAELLAMHETTESALHEALKTKDDLAAAVTTASNERLKAENERDDAINHANRLDIDIGTLNDELKTAKSALEAEKQAKDDAESTISALRGQLMDSESLLTKANASCDKHKARVDELSSQVGALRAEADTLRTQAASLTTARDELSSQLSDYKLDLKEAKNKAENAEKQAKNSENEANERLNNAKLTVLASIRSILDESLKMLLTDEQQWIKDAARKPEQFKEITAGHYHHFLSRLTSQLSGAASAMEAVGCSRVDVAKIASEYVSESRTKLHNVYHTTNRADLRVAIRNELGSWEGRRQSLLNWIGE